MNIGDVSVHADLTDIMEMKKKKKFCKVGVSDAGTKSKTELTEFRRHFWPVSRQIRPNISGDFGSRMRHWSLIRHFDLKSKNQAQQWKQTSSLPTKMFEQVSSVWPGDGFCVLAQYVNTLIISMRKGQHFNSDHFAFEL